MKISQSMTKAMNMKTRKFNIVVLGDPYCGKTSILERYTKGHFGPHYVTTIGAEFYKRQIEIDGKQISLFVLDVSKDMPHDRIGQEWNEKFHTIKFADTAGQESMKTVIKSIYRKAQGIMLVFDHSRKKTLKHIKDWLDLIEMNCEITPELLLVGNKIDLPESKREVSSKHAQSFAESKDMKFYSVSAKLNLNIDEAFNDLAKQIYDNRKRLHPESPEESIRLQGPPDKSECCSR